MDDNQRRVEEHRITVIGYITSICFLGIMAIGIVASLSSCEQARYRANVEVRKESTFLFAPSAEGEIKR